MKNVNLYGEVKNTNDSVIFSKYGDIVIDSQKVNLNGLVYAPFGSVKVNAQNLNLNNVVIIAESIVLTCPNVNANISNNASAFVGATIEIAIALGTLTGIPETAQYVHQTCCSASMADCLAAEWEDDICDRMAVNSLGVRYTNEGSNYVDPYSTIDYQRYVIALRQESNENFLAMQEAGIISSLKDLLNKDNISDAKQVKKDLSYDFLKKLHYFIDARVYAND